ncbi:hydroxypyruvate reductase [Oxobacter pfennigii]|uniref:Hydroxypyruvate reductase n=1 Tax=Oxobacter pfennigii TaxID=36849 RepID=A0A0P9AHE1_9CLOT|nr:hydroxyacid dehydrogenase [Oxobacter pfennigii]KPU44887.1 hydroxypyruvate reductase [Oxobacter pfennigii]
MSFTVLIPQNISKNGINYLMECGYKIKMGNGCDEKAITEDVVDCDAILVRNVRITPKIIDAGNKLKVIARHGVGLDTIDVDYAEKKGVWVTNAPLSNTNAVAEHTMFLLLSCSKNAKVIDEEFRNGNFDIRNTVTNIELKGKTLGIIGLGRIGQSVAKKAFYGFSMNVIGYKPRAKREDIFHEIVLKDNIQEVLECSDFVTLHLPLLPATKKSIGMEQFVAMKKESYFINTSRGAIIKEGELIEALEKKVIAGAAIDVFEEEPPNANDKLLHMNNVIVTPHNAAFTYESYENMAMDAALGVHEVLSGKIPTWAGNRPQNT